MRSAALLSILSAFVATATAGDAPVVSGNPPNVSYIARLPTSNPIKGDLLITTGPDGASGTLNVYDLPSEGPFSYHIHVNPVNASGSCASTGGHLDPYSAGGSDCDPKNPQSCEVGDLSGKYGPIEGTKGIRFFTDPYLSLQPDTPAFIGNRSFVIHGPDGSRIACGSFEFADLYNDNGGGNPVPTGTGGVPVPTNGTGNVNPTVTTPIPSPTQTGAAAKLTQSVLGLLGVLTVGIALL